MRRLVAVLWPSFFLAAFGSVGIFTLFDQNFDVVCGNVHDPEEHLGVYSLTFFGFWLFGAVVSALALYFAKPVCSLKDSNTDDAITH